MANINSRAAQHISRAKPHTTDEQAAQNQPQAGAASASDAARELASARQAVQKASDVRDQKVAEIKQRVQDGTYDVPSRVLARNILDQQPHL